MFEHHSKIYMLKLIIQFYYQVINIAFNNFVKYIVKDLMHYFLINPFTNENISWLAIASMVTLVTKSGKSSFKHLFKWKSTQICSFSFFFPIVTMLEIYIGYLTSWMKLVLMNLLTSVSIKGRIEDKNNILLLRLYMMPHW